MVKIVSNSFNMWTFGFHQSLKNNCQILILTLSEFERLNFYFPWNHSKTMRFLMIQRQIEVN